MGSSPVFLILHELWDFPKHLQFITLFGVPKGIVVKSKNYNIWRQIHGAASLAE